MSELGSGPASNVQSSGFFSWVIPALKSRRTLKTWFRCCTALVASLVLMVVNKSLEDMGQAAFFAAIVAVMLPPYIALSLFILAAFTLLFGMVLGWAWGAAAMAAGISVRSQALLAQQQQEAQASLIEGIPQTLQYQRFVFEGRFLDPRSTTVYGVFLFLGTFALGTLRAFIPKLGLLSIFATIVLDIMPQVFPVSQYTLPKLFIIPTGYYIAIAIATLVLIFPESLNRLWLTSLLNEFLDPIAQILSLQSKSLYSRPSDRKAWDQLTDDSYASRQVLIAGTQGLLAQIRMTDLEFSVGRLGPGDLKRVSTELKSLMLRAAGLHAFQVFVKKTNTLHEAVKDKSTSGRYLDLHQQMRERETKHGHGLDSLVPILAASSADLRTACDMAVGSASEWIRDCNSGRWAGFFSRFDKAQSEVRHEALVQRLAALQGALEHFRKVERIKLVKPFEKFFDPATGLRIKSEEGDKNSEVFSARSLYICFVFSYALDAFADRLVKFLEILIDLDGKRPKPRLWAPSGFGKLGRKLMSRREIDKHTVPLSMGTSDDPTAFDTPGEDSDDEDEDAEYILEDKHSRKNPDALPPTTAFGRAFLRVGQILRFFKSPEGIFGMRHAIVSIALWVPAVLRSSAWFNYEHRGVWALIMAQTGLAVYAGDQIAGFVVRMAGTAFGLLVGMAVWYIGAGSGNGNPYGIAIATTAFVAPFLLGRLAAPAQQMMLWTMTGVTVVFVVGYSWIDTHLEVLVSSGVGVTLGWKRALLVVIGFTACFIVMMFPRPTSSRTLVRQTLAATTGEIGHIIAIEVEALLAEEARARAGHHENVPFVGDHTDQKASPKEMRVRKIAHKVLVVVTRLQDLEASLQTARFEPQLSGTWPHEKYQHLFSTHMNILSSLVLFSGAFAQLDTKWCSILVHHTALLNPNLLSDVFSNISILSYALAGAHPLPPSLPSLRDRVVYHERLASHVTPGNSKLSDVSASDTDSLGDLDFAGDKVAGKTLGFEKLSLDILMDEQLPAHATALVALSNVITLVDEMSSIVRDLCGERTFPGLNEFHKDFAGREEKMIGGGLSHRFGLR